MGACIQMIHNRYMISNNSNGKLTAAIVGATGAVGQEILHLLENKPEYGDQVRLFASARSAGSTLPFRGQDHPVLNLESADFSGCDVAFFSAGAARSKAFVPQAIQQGAFVADNSSAFRMDPEVPLVVPEINGNLVTAESNLVSVPNCSAIILLMAIEPLRRLGRLSRIIVSTYQSASGGGASMMQRLLDETRYYLQGEDHPEPNHAYPPYAFNLFSHNTPIDESGANEEEAKVVLESRKILGEPNLKINVTCVRVPVLRAHTESITVEFEGNAPKLDEVRLSIQSFSGVQLVDDRRENKFPTPRMATGQGDVLVGRLREDPSQPNAICLLAAGDQLLKGAALTAVQIAELAVVARKAHTHALT